MLGMTIDDLQRTEESRLRRFFMRRFRNAADAADATQETFLRLLQVQERTLIENPQAYLFQIAKSVASRTAARLAADAMLFLPEEAGANQPMDAPCQERIVNGRQCLVLMAKAIERLPNRCQEVFILSRLHGMPNGVIAEKLGISRNMVEKHIIRALIHCRKSGPNYFFEGDVRKGIRQDSQYISGPRQAGRRALTRKLMTRQYPKGREDRITGEAAGWVARLQSSDATENDRWEFEQWLGRDPAHGTHMTNSRGFGRISRTSQ